MQALGQVVGNLPVAARGLLNYIPGQQDALAQVFHNAMDDADLDGIYVAPEPRPDNPDSEARKIFTIISMCIALEVSWLVILKLCKYIKQVRSGKKASADVKQVLQQAARGAGNSQQRQILALAQEHAAGRKVVIKPTTVKVSRTWASYLGLKKSAPAPVIEAQIIDQVEKIAEAQARAPSSRSQTFFSARSSQTPRSPATMRPLSTRTSRVSRPLTVRPPAKAVLAARAKSPSRAAPKAPSKRVPAKRLPAKRLPAKRVPAKRVPAKKASAEGALAKKPPAKRSPAKRAPSGKPAKAVNSCKTGCLPGWYCNTPTNRCRKVVAAA